MKLTKHDIKNMDRIKRLNLINSCTGIKPANLIGTTDQRGNLNVAIFSSVVHLGSDPALLGFITRPTGDETRDTYNNIKEVGYYTINHIQSTFISKAHFTSAKFESHVSEFDESHLTPKFVDDFPAPFVKESNIQIGLRFIDENPIKANGTLLIIGEIEHLIIPTHNITKEGYINLTSNDSIGISGLNSYYKLQHTIDLPYARKQNKCDFINE